MMDIAMLSTTWPIKIVAPPELLGGGINNRTFRVRSDSGEYILRIYPPSVTDDKIASEMALLTALSEFPLPFRVPMPLFSRTGDLAPSLEAGGKPARSILVPAIPGTVREPSSPEQAFAAGATLGILTKAMQSISLPTMPGGNYADLERIDPLLPDPLDAADLPFVDAASRKRLARLLEGMMTERHSWYRILPRQIIHGDYVPFNLLWVGERISAVLDFELAANDLRALDFAIGLWPWLWNGRTLTWQMAESFGRGYTAHQMLAPDEAEALPFLLRLRRAVTLVWWSGRYRRGAADEAVTRWAASSALEMEDWLSIHHSDLKAFADRLI